jgi:signal transduction histidine kinase/DNA-binding response OmpR family regulator
MPGTTDFEKILQELARYSHPCKSGDFDMAAYINGLSAAEREAVSVFAGAAYGHMAAMEEDIAEARRARETLDILNRAALILLARQETAFDNAMSDGLGLLSGIADIDRMSVFRNTQKPDGWYLSQLYRWQKAAGGTVDVWPELRDIPHAALSTRLGPILEAGNCVGGSVGAMPERDMFRRFGCVVILLVPVFDGNKFWGIVLFERLREAEFTGEETDVLRSASFMLANAVIRHEDAATVRQANEQSQIMLNAVPLAVTMWDENLNVIDCSETAIRLLGFAGKQDLLDRFLHFLPEYQPDGKRSYDRMAEYLGAAFEKGRSHCEFAYLTTSGEPILFDASLFRMKYKGGFAVIAYCRDIREEKKMEAGILAAKKEADKANAAKGTFLATMSHEIRTPLNTVIGMTAIGRRSADAERKNYALDKIEEASAHLLGVINDILDMSKIEAGKLELSPVEFNLEHMLQKVITVISYRIGEKKQQFSVNIGGDVPRFVIGDDQRLAQVITNLLANATKFTPEGGEIRLEVSLLGAENGVNEIRVEVADSGIGITPEQQARLFRSFEQAESGISRDFGGTGLGLAISKRLVEMMGGKIWVESEAGKGARFLFTAKVPNGAKNLRSLLKPGVKWESVRVLAVDGSDTQRRYFKETFDRLNVRCETAADGAAARRFIEQHGGFDIYFIDLHTPGTDAAELTGWIKAHGERGAAVLISSGEWEGLQETVGSCGADKGLVKPILSSALVDCINECLGNPNEAYETGHADEFAGKTLLLAEDIEINREIVMSLLEGTGLEIECAENGAEALAMMEANPGKYDVIFIDVQMPVMDGLEATRRIRALPAAWCGEIPVIAMTANVFKDDIEKCLAAGMNGHIGKPVSVDDMTGKLREYLTGAENTGDKPRYEKLSKLALFRGTDRHTAGLREGTKVSVDIRVYDGEGRRHILSLPSVIEEVYPDGFFLIRPPVYHGAVYPLPQDEMFLIYFMAEKGEEREPEMFVIPARFVERIERERSVYAKLEPLGNIEPSQRRDCYRLPILIAVTLKRAAAGSIPADATTIDFSDGGMLLATAEKLSVNEKIILEFRIQEREIVEGTILRAERAGGEQYKFLVAVQFAGISKEQKERFYQFIAQWKMRSRLRQEASRFL